VNPIDLLRAVFEGEGDPLPVEWLAPEACGEGVQADRGNLREIPDPVGLGRNARARGSRRRLGVADEWRQGDVKRLEESAGGRRRCVAQEEK
jgi:hypothetical protein